MKRERVRQAPEKKKNRILFFDLIRILCVAVIVYAHLQYAFVPGLNSLLFADGYLPLNFYTAGLQGWAVYGLILVSGAVLEYNYQQITGFVNYTRFQFRRFVRLYPAFWMSLVFGLLVNILLTSSGALQIIRENIFYILFEYTGFFIILGKGPGFINIMGWFIATIVCLYLLFPYLSDLIRRYRLPAILGLMVISFGSRSLFYSYSSVLPDAFWMWFPLCNVFEFGLGIYLIQNSLYPKNDQEYPLIHEIAELSYYVFLFHVIIIQVFHTPTWFSTWFSGAVEQQFQGLPVLGYTIWYLAVEVMVIIVSVAAMAADRSVQRLLRRNHQIGSYLKKA